MKTSKESLMASMDEAHVVMTRDKHAMAVVVTDGLILEAVLFEDHVELSNYVRINGYPVTTMVLPFRAFDEILDLIISFGRD